jgi:hypothetical protein
MNKSKTIFGIFLIQAVFLWACNPSFDRVSEDKFIGEWELTGRGTFNGIYIKIDSKNDKLTGQITKLNDNKYVQMFAEIGDIWISDISRKSNYEFSLTEKKLAGALFSMYGLSTNTKYVVQFIDDNTFALAKSGNDPTKSEIKYRRIIQ